MKAGKVEPLWVAEFDKLGERWKYWQKASPGKGAVGVYRNGSTAGVFRVLGCAIVRTDYSGMVMAPTGHGSIIAIKSAGLPYKYVGDVVFQSDDDGILFLGVCDGVGLVYLDGNGRVIMPDGKETILPGVKETYEEVDPKEYAFVMKDCHYMSVVAKEDGQLVGIPTGGEVGSLFVNDREIELLKNEFDDGFLVTKQFGRIKVRTSRSVISPGFSIYLTSSQKNALREFLGDKKSPDAAAQTAEAEYSGAIQDGSRFRIVLVKSGAGFLAKEVGYRFKATSIGVDRVIAKDGRLFGESDGQTLSFQMPILVEFKMDTNIMDDSAGSMVFEYVDVSIKETSPDVYACTLAPTDKVDKQYKGDRFSMEEISLGPGGKLDGKYTFTLKRVRTKVDSKAQNGMVESQFVFGGTKENPIPTVQCDIAVLVGEGTSKEEFKFQKFKALLTDVYYEGQVVGSRGGLARPTSGEVGGLSLEGTNIPLEDTDISSGLLKTKQYGKLNILLNSSPIHENAVLVWRPKQFTKFIILVNENMSADEKKRTLQKYGIESEVLRHFEH